MGIGTGNGAGSRKGQIRPGEIRNPAGRPKGHKALAQALRDEIGGAEGPLALAQYAIRVWRGEEDGVTSHAQRWEAFCWIKDNAFGKAPLEINLSMGDEKIVIAVPDMSKLTDDQLRLIQEAHDVAVSVAGVIDV